MLSSATAQAGSSLGKLLPCCSASHGLLERLRLCTTQGWQWGVQACIWQEGEQFVCLNHGVEGGAVVMESA